MRRLGSMILAALLLSAHAAAQPDPAAPEESAADLAPCTEGADAAAQSETPDAKPSPSIAATALKDTVSILGAPLHWDGRDWLVFGGIAAGVTAVGFAFDTPVRNKTQSHQTATLDELTKVVEPFGAQYSWAVVGAYGIAGFVFHDPDAKDIFFDSAMASILASGIITPTLKLAIGRERPNESVSSTVFHPFSGNDASFPSGHATQAFAVASVISAHSDEVWVSVAAYSVAGLVGFARIYHNAHWTSDVTAGALIGTFVGRGVVALNKKLRSGDTSVRIAFAPIIGDHVKGAGFLVAF